MTPDTLQALIQQALMSGGPKPPTMPNNQPQAYRPIQQLPMPQAQPQTGAAPASILPGLFGLGGGFGGSDSSSSDSGGGGGRIGGAVKGGVSGAEMGSTIAPPYGTIIGGILGALAGFFGSK